MHIVEMTVEENLRRLQFTVLTHPNGFSQKVASTLTSVFCTEVYTLPSKPNHLIIKGMLFTEEHLRMYIPPGTMVESVVGYDNPRLPFRPPL